MSRRRSPTESRSTLGLRLTPLFAVTACYTYQPLTAPEPAIGTRVSAQLTDGGSRELATRIGPNVLHVEGRVLAADSASLDLSVRQVENYRGVQSDWNGERVAVPRQLIAGLQQRRLSPGGTGLLAAVGTAVMFALTRALGGDGVVAGPGGSGGQRPTQ